MFQKPQLDKETKKERPKKHRHRYPPIGDDLAQTDMASDIHTVVSTFDVDKEKQDDESRLGQDEGRQRERDEDLASDKRERQKKKTPSRKKRLEEFLEKADSLKSGSPDTTSRRQPILDQILEPEPEQEQDSHQGYRYSEIKVMRRMVKKKGAPTKRPEIRRGDEMDRLLDYSHLEVDTESKSKLDSALDNKRKNRDEFFVQYKDNREDIGHIDEEGKLVSNAPDYIGDTDDDDDDDYYDSDHSDKLDSETGSGSKQTVMTATTESTMRKLSFSCGPFWWVRRPSPWTPPLDMPVVSARWYLEVRFSAAKLISATVLCAIHES